MATKMDKIKLAQTINDLPELDSETKSQLLQLIHERKQYGLVWEEHREEVEQQMQTQLPVLVEDKSKFIDSADPQAPNHILIEGDNLPALTTLTYTHKEKIDVIYIDPPYNTGNKDFIYNDHFVGTDDDYRHSKWLSFMSKRLRIAKTLLSDKGVIFISIDDNEQAQLKMLCDEIFGAGNFVGTFVRLSTKSGKTPVNFMVSHEYILCYANKKDVFRGVPFKDDSYKYEDEFLATRGAYNLKQPLDCNSISYSPSLDYVIEHDGRLYYPGGDKEKYEKRKSGDYNSKDYAWRWSKDLYEFGLQNGWIVFRGNKIYTKGYLGAVIAKDDDKNYTIQYIDKERKRSTIDFISNEYSNDVAKKQLARFELNCPFDFPKPYNLISDLIATHISKSATILDFFAGSGTTLHATMQLNAEDGGHRQCILITNNENNICEEVTYERNKRVIQGYTTPKGEPVAGLTANKLRYYRTDFVARESSLTAKKQLMLAATDLLCIKESIYTECHTFGNLRLRSSVVRYFADADAQMLIIYNPDAIDTIVAEISRMDIISPIRIYVFSANDYAYNADFEAVDNKVSLCALPAAIYNAYRKVLPKKQQPQDEPATTDTELTFEEDTL